MTTPSVAKDNRNLFWRQYEMTELSYVKDMWGALAATTK